MLDIWVNAGVGFSIAVQGRFTMKAETVLGYNPKINLAVAVLQLRKELNLSQHQLALKLGCQTAMISHWETSVQKAGYVNLLKLALLAPNPYCWDFLAAAGISRDFVNYFAKLGKKRRIKS